MAAVLRKNLPGDIERLRLGEELRFPVGIAVAGIVATGLGLAISAMGIQWGAAPAAADALDMAWVDVNVAMLWTWLLVWPAVGLWKGREGRSVLGWDFAVLLAAAIPAMAVAGFLSGVTGPMVWRMLALQAGVGLFALGAMGWGGRLGVGTVAGALATLGVASPVAGYLWTEFFPAAGQAWRGFIPVTAAARAARWGTTAGGITWWVAAAYGVIGILLLLWNVRPEREDGKR